MVKSYNELLRDVVRELKERNVYHKLITFNHRPKYMPNISKWINVMFPLWRRGCGFNKLFEDSNINIGIEDKLTSQEEANRIKTDIIFKLIMNLYIDNHDLYRISSHYKKLNYDDYKHKNRNEMFYMIHGGTVVASIGSIMLICLINSIFGIYCAIGFTGLLILNILVIIVNLFIFSMKKDIIFNVK